MHETVLIYAVYIISLITLSMFTFVEAFRYTHTCGHTSIKLHRLKHVELTLFLILVESMGGILFYSDSSLADIYRNTFFNILVGCILIFNLLFVQHLFLELEPE